ncbi:hypothetical protein EDB89DRAFT_1911092 [Lactarius sanguifluus]|nr:hypothetical protein EDB89DRAFT_1911092 [Lactarius sanguifluus]
MQERSMWKAQKWKLYFFITIFLQACFVKWKGRMLFERGLAILSWRLLALIRSRMCDDNAVLTQGDGLDGELQTVISYVERRSVSRSPVMKCCCLSWEDRENGRATWVEFLEDREIVHLETGQCPKKQARSGEGLPLG